MIAHNASFERTFLSHYVEPALVDHEFLDTLDLLALTGDAVDNVPGVDKVGPKTAAKLVHEHGSVSLLLENLSSVKNDKLRAKLKAEGGAK